MIFNLFSSSGLRKILIYIVCLINKNHNILCFFIDTIPRFNKIDPQLNKRWGVRLFRQPVKRESRENRLRSRRCNLTPLKDSKETF
jgi:hypothetical protein